MFEIPGDRNAFTLVKSEQLRGEKKVCVMLKIKLEAVNKEIAAHKES